MDTFDPARSAVQEWSVGVDERGFATYDELAMARAPLRRVAGQAVPAPAVLPGKGDRKLGGVRVRRPGRPGRRW